MQITVKGRHMAITDPIRAYAEEKIAKAGKLFDHNNMTAEVELYHEKNPSIERNQVAEVTIHTKGPVIRAKEAETDMYAAIDLVSEKLEKQIRKYKGKLKDRHSARAAQPPVPAPEIALESEEPEAGIVKTKVLQVKPMTEDEAMLQMELLGHDFFVFVSADTDLVNVLYRRADGDYGLIEPRR
jgi:putative sigma-54 modulation protein